MDRGTPLIWLWGSLASGTDGTIQQIHELVWDDAEALNLAAQIPGADVATRIEAVVALGRLQTPAATLVLQDLATDADPSVQVAVADALITAEGGEDLARDWLASLSPGPTPETRGRYVALIRTLGRQGTSSDVPLVASALRHPWPVGAEAAAALSAMARRGVEGVDVATSALVGRLAAMDPRTVASAAACLATVGLGGATPAERRGVRDRQAQGTTPEVSARLLTAIWPWIDADAREARFLAAATDPAVSLRRSALGVLQPGDLPAYVIGAFLADPDLGVRQAAVAALARDPSDEALDVLGRFATEAEAGEAASAWAASGVSDDGIALDPLAPAPVRRVFIPYLDDLELLTYLALHDREAQARSAAAGSVADHPDAETRQGAQLLEADDPVVRRVGVEILGRDGSAAVAALIPLLRTEADHRVQAAGLQTLARLAPSTPIPTDRVLKTVLFRAASSPSVATRRAGGRLAEALGLEPVAPRPPESIEIVLADRRTVSVDVTAPEVATARQIRGARIETTQGSFRVALDPDRAPYAVAHFARLAEAGFYDDQVFFDVVAGAYAMTGCPRGDGLGDPGYTVPVERSGVPFEAGAMGLPTGSDGSVGSQWFVVGHQPADRFVDATWFGHLVAGAYVVERLVPGDRIVGIEIERVVP